MQPPDRIFSRISFISGRLNSGRSEIPLSVFPGKENCSSSKILDVEICIEHQVLLRKRLSREDEGSTVTASPGRAAE
jgi:hypothetical protein